jgi:pyridoxamine 5'-phosphate oxidase
MLSSFKRLPVMTLAASMAGLASAHVPAGQVPRRAFCAASLKDAVDLATLRKEYSRQGLDEKEMGDDPMETFETWIQEAINAKCIEPNAMCVSTCKDNVPSARFVLLKAHDKRGFVWYTNYQSRKGDDIAANPAAAITFWWGDLERSVRIEGKVEKVSEQESDEYFNKRPRGAQIGAWTSNQSRPIISREDLAAQEQSIIDQFQGVATVTRPPHWGGYRLVPTRIEFWKGRESRLHDRLVYERERGADEWTKPKRLQP